LEEGFERYGKCLSTERCGKVSKVMQVFSTGRRSRDVQTAANNWLITGGLGLNPRPGQNL